MSFLTPLFLAAAGLALVPVLLHLVRRMRAREVPFSSLMFLQATPMERIRRRKLRDILLLLLRMAMLVLLALAFARPFFERGVLPMVSERTDESVVILVDQSLSMQAGEHFAEAQDLLEQFVAEAASGDEIALVGFSDQAQQLSPLTQDRELLTAASAALSPTHRTTDYYPALQLAEDILGDARHAAQRVVLISDLQQSGFSPSMSEYSIPDGVSLDVRAVGSDSAPNRYFDDFLLTTQRRAEHTVVRFDTRRHALERGEPVELWIEEESMGRQVAAAAGLGTATFQQIVPRAGLYQGRLALESDDLDADNRHYFTYSVSQRPSVHVVAADDDAFFLRSAFELASDTQFDYSRGQRITGGALYSHDVVFVANQARLTAQEAAVLRSFAERGGAVVLSFGGEIQGTTGYAFEPLGVGALGDVIRVPSTGSEDAFIGQVAAQHAALDIIAGSSALFRPKFRSYVHVEPAGDATVLGRYDNGDPFLVERRIGQGTVLVYTSSFGTSWTDLPLQELFVPLVYQLAIYGTTLGEHPRQFFVGDPVPLAGRPESTIDVSTPQGEVYKVDLDSTGTGHFRESEQPGHYVAALPEGAYAFSVNTDPVESDLTYRGAEETYAAVAGSPSGTQVASLQPTLSAEETEQDQKLWRLAILAVIGLFATETLIAHRKRATLD